MNSFTSRTSALVAGLAYLALGAISLTGSVPDEHWGTRGDLVNLLGLIGFGCTVLGAEVLREPLDLGRLGRVGLRTAQLGLVAMTVESAVSQVHGGNTLSPLFFLGLLLTLLGFLVLGIDGIRRPGARWVALLPFLGLLVSIAGGEHGGFLVYGVIWSVLGGAIVGPSRSRPSSLPSGSVTTM